MLIHIKTFSSYNEVCPHLFEHSIPRFSFILRICLDLFLRSIYMIVVTVCSEVAFFHIHLLGVIKAVQAAVWVRVVRIKQSETVFVAAANQVNR